MHGLLMLLQSLSVVGGDNEQRVVAQVVRGQRRVQAPDELIGPCDLAVIQTILVL